MAYLDSHGLQTLWNKIKTSFAASLGVEAGNTTVTVKLKDKAATPNQLSSIDIPHATGSSAGVMSKDDYTKLDGVEAGANNYVHPTTAGNKHIPSGGSSGQILGWTASGTAVWIDAPETGVTQITAGDNITLTPAGGTGIVEIEATDTVYVHPSYTAKANGLYKITVDATGHVSAVTAVAKSDITALGIPAQDTVYTHPTFTAKSEGLYKVTVNSEGHVSGATAVAKSDITGLGIPAQDTTYVFNTTYDASTNKAATMSDIESAMAGAAKYKGTLASEAEFTALTNYKVGEYWVVSTSFVHTVAGGTITLDAGNMVFVRTASATYSSGNFDIIQADIEAIPDSVINALS